MERELRSIEDFDLEGQRVFIRVDFNVPLANGSVADDARIKAAIPTINHALENDARVIIGSHFGRPKGEVNPKFSLLPVASRLAELLDREVIFPESCIGDGPRKLVQDLRDGEVILLENLRFEPGEESNDEGFARELAAYCDIYINDAFGAAHRCHASVDGLPKLIENRGAGFLMQKEIENLGQLLAKPERPYVAILGGSKVSTKIGAFDSLMMHADAILVGGAMAYTFLKAQGVQTGASMVENAKLAIARRALLKAEDRGVNVCLPTDHIIVKDVDPEADATVCTNSTFPADGIAVDIGPETVDHYKKIISEAKTVFWNGPMGIFEMKPFAKGTNQVADAVAHAPGKTVVGGGDSLLALKQSGFLPDVTHASTGGGASLEFIEGKELPGLEALMTLKVELELDQF